MMINSKRQSPVWPYLGILACLFMLSITAPRAWDRMGRQETLSHLVSTRKAAPAPVFCNQSSVLHAIVDSTEPQAQTAAVHDELPISNEPAGPLEPPPAAPEIVQEVRE